MIFFFFFEGILIDSATARGLLMSAQHTRVSLRRFNETAERETFMVMTD